MTPPPPPSTTKTWSYTNTGYPSALNCHTHPTPTAPPTPHHMLLRTRACALNPVDIQLMNLPLWSLPLPFPPFSNTRKPVGMDFAGEMLAVGGEVAGWEVGDKVMGLSMPFAGSGGACGELGVVDCRGSVLARVPERDDGTMKWSWGQAASLPLVWLTSRTCIEAVRASVEGGGGKVVVLGASSSTGMYTVLQAKRRGWTVLGTCSGRNAAFAKEMGADEVVDYTTESVYERVRDFAPDAIIDCVGGTECLGLAKRYVTIVGDKTTRSSVGGSLIYLWNPQMVLRWALGRAGVGVWYDCVNLQGKKDWLEEASGLEKEQVIVDSEWEFEQAREAFERLNTGRARGKVVLRVGEDLTFAMS
ncbi:MAG: zinc ion binding [Chrysothrix sp. TS-e1954]|nr:MAG: zinc ion binding [Chrysothrix sp. TS-e1954]